MKGAMCIGLFLWLLIEIVYGCNNANDCQLNGDCVNGVCHCDPAWSGSTCSVLDLLPAPLNGGLKRPTISSWGGSVIFLNGLYHMYAAEMSYNCGLNTWGTNSIIVHATSSTPAGPYTKVDEVMSFFSHNPTVVANPDGTLLIYHIGNGAGGTNPKHCTNGSTPNFEISPRPPAPLVNEFLILTSNSPNGPWKVFNPTGGKCDGTTTVQGYSCDSVDNPAPIINSDGSVFALKRSWNSNTNPDLETLIGVAKAPSWKGPYTHSHNPVFLNENEDPFVYRNKRGYHALFHGMNPYEQDKYAGRHAFSTDGWDWTFSSLPAYNSTVIYTDGSSITFNRRERPHLLLNSQSEPTHLFTGVQQHSNNDYVFTHVQPIKT